MKRLLLAFLLLALCGAGAAAGVRWTYDRPGPLAEAVTIVLPKGIGTPAIGQQLRQAGVVDSAWMFAAIAKYRALRRHPPLKAGEYAFTPRESLHDILAEIEGGHIVVHRVTIPEGFTNRQIVAMLDGQAALSGGTGALPAEGQLWPETYTFTLGDPRSEIVRRMHAAAARALQDAWQQREPSALLPGPEAALTLASIVEKETGLPQERAKVAAVFLNRLKAGMRLQSDPTIIYVLSDGLGQLSRPLGHSDLALGSPYNTYQVAGLPPGPICNPGKASLDAVMHPANDASLYFVATGHGGHAFAVTLENHDRNVADYVKTLHDRTHDKP